MIAQGVTALRRIELYEQPGEVNDFRDPASVRGLADFLEGATRTISRTSSRAEELQQVLSSEVSPLR